MIMDIYKSHIQQFYIIAIMQQRASFYLKNDLMKFHRQNVLYVAYIGKYNNQEYYKYGISTNIYQREYEQHRKTFETFEMQFIKKTYNMHQVEDMLEKELKIRNLHATLTFKKRGAKATTAPKRQTELFVTNNVYDLKYIRRLINRIVNYYDRDIIQEMKKLKTEIKQKDEELMRLRSTKQLPNSCC